MSSKAIKSNTFWQLEQKGVRLRNQHLLETGQNSDCEFLVGQDRISFKAHKLLISSASPVFQKMFFGEFQQNVIEIDDANPNAFKAMLSYIYIDKLPIKNVTEACNIAYLAEKYMMPHLSQLSVDYISKNLNVGNVCQVYEFAVLFNIDNLIKRCKQIIINQANHVLKHASFEDIPKPTLIMILELDRLAISSEVQLYEAVVRWVKAEIVRKGIEDQSEKQRLYDELLPRVRFAVMEPQDFAEGPAVDGYIPQADAFAMLIHLCSPNSKKGFPDKYKFPEKYKYMKWNRHRSISDHRYAPGFDEYSLPEFQHVYRVDRTPINTYVYDDGELSECS